MVRVDTRAPAVAKAITKACGAHTLVGRYQSIDDTIVQLFISRACVLMALSVESNRNPRNDEQEKAHEDSDGTYIPP